MEDRMLKLAEETLERTIKDGLTTNNLDIVYKLSKIKHLAKEDKEMNYGNYGGRRPGYDSYGNYGENSYGEYGRGSYGRRGYDMRYRGNEHLDRTSEEYGRYMANRERYGASPETDKAFEYMVKSLEDFIKYLHEEAETPQQHQMLNETLQRSMR